MTLFEYLAIAFSLVFSLAGTRLVGGLPHAVASGRRYWVHLCLVWFQLLATVVVFWNFWSFRDVAWTFPTFLLVLASPGLVYYNASVLVPVDAAAVESWRVYYYSVHRRYFVGVACWALVVALGATEIWGMPMLHPFRAIQAVAFVMGVAGAATANERVHATIVVVYFLLLLTPFTVWFPPDWLTAS